MSIKKRIAKWLGIQPTVSQVMRESTSDFWGRHYPLEIKGDQVSPGMVEIQEPYTVTAYFKDDGLEPIVGEVTIPIEQLCQALTDGTKGVKIGGYLIPTKEIRYFKIESEPEEGSPCQYWLI